MKPVLRPHRANMVTWAREKQEVLVLTADLTASCEADAFRDAFGDRYFSLGMAEQNMIGVAAGLAREGFVPFVHTFAVFICRRAFDQVAMSIGYPNLRVRLLGFLPGITTPGGVTHQAVDDLALMRSIPNMTIVECGDATEVESVLDASEEVNGPMYIRMLRGVVPRLFPSEEPLRIGRPRVLHRGTDIAVISSGICTGEAIKAYHALEKAGISTALVHISTLKPWKDDTLHDVLSEVEQGVITVENHSTIGALGSAVAETIAEAGHAVPLRRLGLKDTYAHGASLPYLMREYGLDGLAIVREAELLLGTALPHASKALEAIGMRAFEKTLA